MSNSRAILKPLREAVKWLWYARGRIPILNAPMPWRFPPGYWFLIYPDEMGLNLFSSGRLFSVEEGECRFLSKFIQPGMVCFDIGANQGFLTLLLSKYVGPQGWVFAFEPTWLESRRLKRNAQISRVGNVVLERMALGFQEGVTDVFVCLDGHGSRSSLREPPAEVKARTEAEKVPITTLDSYVRNHGIKQINFIKIDAEGSERDILRGGIEVLTTLRPLLMIEMADVVTQQFGYPSVENYKCLESHGFVWFEVTSSGLLKLAKLKSTYRENLIAVPREKLQRLSDLVEAP